MTNLPIRTVVIHCSDSPHRGDTAEDIHAWHLQRGWVGIGYHYVITEFGEVEYGRPEYWVGSHVRNHNTKSLGICLIGRDTFTDKQMEALRTLVKDIKTRHGDKISVVGHRNLDPGKTCPNFDVKALGL